MFYNIELKVPGTPPVYIFSVELEHAEKGRFKLVKHTLTQKYYNAWLNLSYMQLVAITDKLRHLMDDKEIASFRVEERAVVSIGEKGVSVSIRNGDGYEEVKEFKKQ